MQVSKLTIHMVASLDGFIASENGDVSWMNSLDNYENGIEMTEEFIANFLQLIDCYLMGFKTYEHALELGWPYGNIPCYVLSRKERKSDKSNVHFISGELKEIIENQLKSEFKNIWMVGGSQITSELLKQKLADEICITIAPVLLGKGKLFFDSIGGQNELHLKDVTAFKNGMVDMTYEILK
ncbi:MAG: dihydrofolate reductase family protein [Bacteroidia bacterium]